MSVGAIAPTYERRQFVDFLTPYQDIDTTFATFQKPPAPDVFLAFRPLTLVSALALMVTWLVSSVVLTLLVIKHTRRRDTIQVFQEVTIDMLAVIFKQSKFNV